VIVGTKGKKHGTTTEPRLEDIRAATERLTAGSLVDRGTLLALPIAMPAHSRNPLDGERESRGNQILRQSRERQSLERFEAWGGIVVFHAGDIAAHQPSAHLDVALGEVPCGTQCLEPFADVHGWLVAQRRRAGKRELKHGKRV